MKVLIVVIVILLWIASRKTGNTQIRGKDGKFK